MFRNEYVFRLLADGRQTFILNFWNKNAVNFFSELFKYTDNQSYGWYSALLEGAMLIPDCGPEKIL